MLSIGATFLSLRPLRPRCHRVRHRVSANFCILSLSGALEKHRRRISARIRSRRRSHTRVSTTLSRVTPTCDVFHSL